MRRGDQRKKQQNPRQLKARQKHLDDFVSRAVNLVFASIAGRQPAISSHFFCSASATHSRHPVIWYLFRTDADWRTAKGNGLVSDIVQLTKTALTAGGYAAKGAAQMMVDFTSDEDVQRKTGGDQRTYFQPTE